MTSALSRKRTVENVVFSAGGQGLVQLITLFVLPLFITNLGEELYGIWVISGILLGYVGFFDFGLTEGIGKYIADAHVKKDPVRLRETIATGFAFLLVVGVLSGLAIVMLRHSILGWFNVSEKNYQLGEIILILTGWASAVNWPLRLAGIVLSSTLYIKPLSVARSIYQSGNSVVLLLMVVAVPDLVVIRIATLILQTAFQIFNFFMLRAYIPEAAISLFNFRFFRIREMSSYSLSMFYFKLLGMINFQIQPLIISVLLSPAYITYYMISTKLFTISNRFTGLFNQTVLPTAFNLKAAEDERKLGILIERGVRYRTLLAGPIAVGCVVLSGPFIKHWVGEAYVPHAVWSQLLGLVILTTPLGVALHVARACSQSSFINWVLSLRAVTTLSVLFLGYQTWGFGAAILGLVGGHLLWGDLVFFPKYCRLSGVRSFLILVAYAKLFCWLVVFAVVGVVVISEKAYASLGEFFLWGFVLMLVQYAVLFMVSATKADIHDLRIVFETVGLGGFASKILLDRKSK